MNRTYAISSGHTKSEDQIDFGFREDAHIGWCFSSARIASLALSPYFSSKAGVTVAEISRRGLQIVKIIPGEMTMKSSQGRSWS